MKHQLFFLLAFLWLTGTSAQDADGYYVSKTGDTIRGKIKIPVKPKMKIGASSQLLTDPLKDKVPNESNKIDYSKLTFDIKFAEADSKYKKIDRLKVRGFGFIYEGNHYDFETWDVSATKQIYVMSPFGDVASNGVYFILKSINGAYPVYSLFQEVEMTKVNNPGTRQPTIGPANTRMSDGYASKRDIVFKHPTRGYLYISDQYPLTMKIPELVKYLGVEEAFIKTLTNRESVFDIVMKYNNWKSEK